VKTLKDYIDEMRPAIETTLFQLVNRSISNEFPELREMLAYHMGWEGEKAGPEAQGKRIRPLLVLLCAEAAGGDWQNALPAAGAVELLHNFSLIHDDIQDNSPIRHKRPTVWKKWGIAQAINAGDILFIQAFLILHDLRNTLSPQMVLEANRILQETCLHLTEGQYLDISYEKKQELPLDSYWPMIGGKTSALLGCCAQLGALVGGTEEERQLFFREYGYSLGLAFQVLDDWLGIWGDVALTGKSVESDLVTGKKSLPVLYGLSKSGLFAERWSKGRIKPDEAFEMARILADEGASIFTLQSAERLTKQAMNSLDKAADDNEASRALRELTHMLLKRKK